MHTTLTRFPSLRVCEPHGQEYIIEFQELLGPEPTELRVSLGRDLSNHIFLADPYQTISRYHCRFEYREGHWWVLDGGSANGTFIRTGHLTAEMPEIDVRIEGAVPLETGDEVLILGQVSELDEPTFWRLTFADPNQTVRLVNVNVRACRELAYSLAQKRLYLTNSRERQEIKLTPSQCKLIDYMARQNQLNANQPIVCSYAELIRSIWGTDGAPEMKGNNDVTHLVWGLRRKFEQDSGEPRFLQTSSGNGYLLDIKLI